MRIAYFVISGVCLVREMQAQLPQSLKADNPIVVAFDLEADKAAAKWEKDNDAKAKRCRALLDTLYQAVYRYLLDHAGVWPQFDLTGIAQDDMKVWSKCLQTYGVDADVLSNSSGIGFTNFDDTPLRCYSYSGQPWIVLCTDLNPMPGVLSTSPCYVVRCDGQVRCDGSGMIQFPHMPGKRGIVSIDRGGKKAGKIPEEMKRAAKMK